MASVNNVIDSIKNERDINGHTMTQINATEEYLPKWPSYGSAPFR